MHCEYSMEEYLRLEATSDLKHEWFDGRIVAMSGGTREHAAMAARIIIALGVQLRDRRCVVYTSDRRVRVQETGLDTYPDVSVACGAEQVDDEDPDALVNPIVLIEVTSKSSEGYDRGGKLEHYQRIPSLREVVIVSHREHHLEVHRREGDGWSVHARVAGQQAELASIGCTLDVDDLYRDPLG